MNSWWHNMKQKNMSQKTRNKHVAIHNENREYPQYVGFEPFY